MIGEGLKRSLVRWLHIGCGIPVIGYIYTPFEALPEFAHLVRYGFLPAVLAAGLWMWKGHLVKRMFARSAA